MVHRPVPTYVYINHHIPTEKPTITTKT